jgi:Zn-dependent protease with chaperone function
MAHDLASKKLIFKKLAAVSAILVLLAGFLLSPAFAASDTSNEEVQLGKEAAEQLAKEVKFITDPSLVGRLEAVGKEIARVANEKEIPASFGKSTVTKFDYTFKIIDDETINAFALPGGFIYVNKGLIDFVHSDDELAGVVAHEVAHVAHHHYMQLLKAQQKELLKTAAAIIIVSATGGRSKDVNMVAQMAELIRIAKMSAYGQDAEFDADRTAVAYLAETKYNPVGMLTFMERLARVESMKPKIELGIFATHPLTHLRVREIVAELDKRKIPVNRRLVTKYVQVDVRPVENTNAYSVWVADTEIIRLADSEGESAASRADRIAKKLSGLLLAGARIHNIKTGGDQGESVIVMDQLLVTPTPEDAALVGLSVKQLATSAANALRTALMKERLGQEIQEPSSPPTKQYSPTASVGK